MYSSTYQGLLEQEPGGTLEEAPCLERRESSSGQHIEEMKQAYSTLLKTVDQALSQGDSPQTGLSPAQQAEFEQSKEDFENEFVGMNCQLQNNRSDSQHMQDTIQYSRKVVKVGPGQQGTR